MIPFLWMIITLQKYDGIGVYIFILLGFIKRFFFLFFLCSFLKEEAIMFYIKAVFFLHGILVAALFAMTWLMAHSWIAGILTAAFYILNRYILKSLVLFKIISFIHCWTGIYLNHWLFLTIISFCLYNNFITHWSANSTRVSSLMFSTLKLWFLSQSLHKAKGRQTKLPHSQKLLQISLYM